MRCIFGSKITLMLFLLKCGPCLKRYWNNSPSCYHSLHLKWHFLLLTYNQTVAWPYATMLCIFFKNGFKKKKTKTEAKFGPLSTNDKISLGHAHTATHTHLRRCYVTRMAQRPPVPPTLSSTPTSVPAKFLSKWSRSVAYYIRIRRSP